MRAVRAQDGSIYHISQADLPSPPTVEALHTVLSEFAAIPVSALIVMHPNGRQLDRTSIGSILVDEADDSDEGLVYLFDREALTVDLDSDEGKMLLETLTLNSEHVLDDVGHDPDKQYEASIDLIQVIRHQHKALLAAISNLERHRGGRQDTITAYQHFASPLLTKYADLLYAYPSSMSLVNKVHISAKMQSAQNNAPPRERLLGDYVSTEKMGTVRDTCERVLNEIVRKNNELENTLRLVEKGTEKLKAEVQYAHNVDDLLECEKDANEAHARLRELFSRPGQRSEEEEDELDTLFDECIGRLRYLVERRNAETRQLIHALQDIAKLQGEIAFAPELIRSLNSDVRTKCDQFKHLERLQLLVPAYVASLAESVRRQLFTKHLTTSSSAYAELFSTLSNDERRRRGIYQAEWAGKLPWDPPGLDQGLPFIEVELRSSNPSLGSVRPSQQEPQVTIEDLEALERVLDDIQDNLTPEDNPASTNQHPVQIAVSLIKKLRKNIEKLSADFEKLNRRLEDPDQSPTTSVSVSDSANEALQALEEKRMQLERDLQAERSAREAEVAALQVKNSELERLVAEYAESKSALVTRHKSEHETMLEDHKTRTDDLQAEIDRLTERAAQLAGEKTMHQNEASRLREQLQDAQNDTEDFRRRLADEEERTDSLEKRKQDLLQSLNEKDRLLRDHRTESELDRATLEKELAEAKEKLDALEHENTAQITSLENDLERLRAKSSSQESNNAELQTMCDERGRSISEMRADAQATNVKVATLLALCKTFYGECENFLVHFVREEGPKATRSTQSKLLSSSRGPAADFRPQDHASFDSTSLDKAIEYMESKQSREIWELARAQCESCISEIKKWQKQCRRYKESKDKAQAISSDKIAFREFHENDLALFLPTKNRSERIFAAFNFGKPNHFLKPTGRLVQDIEDRDWIVAKITSIKEGVVAPSDPEVDNPYFLRPGSKYYVLEADFWPNRSTRRTSSMTAPVADKKGTSSGEGDAQGTPSKKVTGTSPEGAFLATPVHASTSLPDEISQMREEAPHEEASFISQVPEETSYIGQAPSVATPQANQEGQPPSTMDFSAFTIVKGDEPAPKPPHLKPSTRSGTSSLSSSRPKDLPIMPESPAVPPLPETIPGMEIVSPGPEAEEPAFLPRHSPDKSTSGTSPQVIPRSSSLSTSKQHPMAFSRSFGSSNGSGGSSGFKNRLSSSSFLTPSKGLPTVASSPGVSSYLSTSRSMSTSPGQTSDGTDRGVRSTQTIGRYTGRGSRANLGHQHARQASASGALAQGSSARELLRSFTASSSGGT